MRKLFSAIAWITLGLVMMALMLGLVYFAEARLSG